MPPAWNKSVRRFFSAGRKEAIQPIQRARGIRRPGKISEPMTLEIYFVIISVLNVVYIIFGNFISLKIMQALDAQPALLPSGQLQQMREYRALLEKEGEHPWFMFYLKSAKWILCFYVALWSSLLVILFWHWLC
jgi:uncharacterized protein YneF (UPF0154 family)